MSEPRACIAPPPFELTACGAPASETPLSSQLRVKTVPPGQPRRCGSADPDGLQTRWITFSNQEICARMALQIRTAFNLLGPLLNPAGAQFGLVGVYSTDISELMAGALMVRLGWLSVRASHALCDPSFALKPSRAASKATGLMVHEWQASCTHPSCFVTAAIQRSCKQFQQLSSSAKDDIAAGSDNMAGSLLECVDTH